VPGLSRVVTGPDSAATEVLRAATRVRRAATGVPRASTAKSPAAWREWLW